MELKFFKCREVKNPSKASEQEAGIDFFIPEEKNYFLWCGADVLIPLGVKIKLPKNHCMLLVNRSSVASKLKLLVGACLIDENYNGEIHAHLINTGVDSLTINRGQKIVQGIILPVPVISINECLDEKDIITTGHRGENGFGSTDIIKEKDILYDDTI